ncbi:ClC family H(+)/Cl(-) exchange transporter [Fusobacterium sp. 1001295B_180824_G3]|uniref:ClC family H(+)/Cl(-) exchange transporter n=1 Tax=Fusobacterium sp. 1001295B_180824_G3 TaxID=2787123 RepID=UPI00189B894B|nr:ClC family H(+)/Cl(-) exchange transporter [Fusobacterium sp. 1001295B_180824_G3]
MNSAKDTVEKLYKGNGKLYLACLLVGVITGVIVSCYRWALEEIGIFRNKYFSDISLDNPISLLKMWLIFIAAGLIVNYLFKKFPKTSGSGIPQVKGLILGRINYNNWFFELLAKFFAGILGIGAGLSLGREGPSVQLGSYVAYGTSKLLKKDIVERNYLLTSGSSAGLAGAFGAPLAGVMFSIEEIHKYLSGKLLICAFVASIGADFVGRRFFGVQTSFNIAIKYPLDINPYFQFFLYVVFGIIIAFFGKLFTVTLVKCQDIFTGVKLPREIKVSFIMTLSFILCFVLPEVTGGGHNLVESLIHGKTIIYTLIIIFVIKLLFTAISYSTGFAGGIFLPMLVLGAIIGKVFGETIDIFAQTGPDFTVHCIVLGMAAYFVAVVRAPITGVILILEMTGSFHLLLALTTVAVVSFYVTELLGQQPVYEILYDRMKKDDNVVDEENQGKITIELAVMAESLLDGKTISEIIWPDEVLIIAIIRNGVEKIPKGRTVMMAGDILVLLLPEKIVPEVKEKLMKHTSVE